MGGRVRWLGPVVVVILALTAFVIYRLVDPTDPPPVAPAGQRLVGWGRAVIAVPKDWPDDNQLCSNIKRDHVYYASDANSSARCPPLRPADGVAVGIGSLDSRLGRYVVGPLRTGRPVGDVGVLDGPPVCETGSAGQRCSQSFAVPSEKVFVTVTVQGNGASAAFRAIRDSLQILPAGWTTVPFLVYGASDSEAEEALRAAGLAPDLPDVNFPHYVTGTEPAMGSVVAEGTRVSLVVGDG